MSSLNIKKPSGYRLISSLLGIIYVWSLPWLSNFGFTESGSTSISQFIANAPATGAMAAISFIPMTLMWEYQDFILNRENYYQIQDLWVGSLVSFQLFYGLFLTCTDGIAPSWLHTSTVILFGTSFIGNSMIILFYVESKTISKVVLSIGILSFLGLLIAQDMWFWACECVGFSSMLLFTPLEWFLLSNNRLSDYNMFTS